MNAYSNKINNIIFEKHNFILKDNDSNNFQDSKLEELEELKELDGLEELEESDRELYDLDNKFEKVNMIIEIDRINNINIDLNKTKINKNKSIPILSEKIFDVIQINNNEYFFDRDLNLLLDIETNPVGFYSNKKYIFYSEFNFDKDKLLNDNKEIDRIMKNFNIIK